jgi:hypothetical protein
VGQGIATEALVAALGWADEHLDTSEVRCIISPTNVASELWLGGIFAMWAPAMVFAVASPVRWISGLLRAEGATVNSVAADEEFTRIERLAVATSVVVWVLSSLAALLVIARQRPEPFRGGRVDRRSERMSRARSIGR